MITRRRKKPFNQGSIKRIYELFFQPLVRHYRSDNQSISSFLEDIFDVQHRYINIYKVKKSFNITGPLYVAGWSKVQGLGYRKVKAGDMIWVREDLREPANVDIEVSSGQGSATQVFYVPRIDWEAFKLNTVLVDLDKDS